MGALYSEAAKSLLVLLNWRFTPFRIQTAQRGPPFSLITAHEVGVLNEKRCNSQRSGDGLIHQWNYISPTMSHFMKQIWENFEHVR